MTTTLSLALSNPAMAPESFWIALEQELPDELATVAEAARVIDEAFEIDPCAAPAEDPQPEELPSLDEMLTTAREIMALSLAAEYPTLCSDSDGGFAATVLVARSHQDRPYTLLVAGGEVEQTITGNVKEIVKTVAVSSISSISLDLPADQQITVAWAGPCYADSVRLEQPPAITVSNCRISWDGAITGTLLVAWAQPYDILTIQAAGQDCTVTALYHLATDEISLQPPPADEQAETLCRQLSGSIDLPDNDDQRPCEELILVEERCECTNEVVDRYYRKESTDCRPGEATHSDVNRGRVELSYVGCDDRGDPDVSSVAFYKETCCKLPRFDLYDLPTCRKRYGKYSRGPDMPTVDRESIIAAYGNNCRFIPVGPDDGICGTQVTEQDINARNCCDGVEALAWDGENSIGVIADFSSGEVFVTGGKSPYQWKVRGSGFFVDAAGTRREEVTTTGALRIWTQNSCGKCVVYVTDGCSSTSGFVLSAVGQWVPIDPLTCPLHDVDAQLYISTSTSDPPVFGFRAERDGYRVEQSYNQFYMEDKQLGSWTTWCTEPQCDNVASTWAGLADAAFARHSMPSGEPTLINPRSGARLFPSEYNFKYADGNWYRGDYHSDPPMVIPPYTANAEGRGFVRHCHGILGLTGYAYCTTMGQVTLALPEIGSTEPKAWEWQC